MQKNLYEVARETPFELRHKFSVQYDYAHSVFRLYCNDHFVFANPDLDVVLNRYTRQVGADQRGVASSLCLTCGDRHDVIDLNAGECKACRWSEKHND